jgi:hypothetical protein
LLSALPDVEQRDPFLSLNTSIMAAVGKDGLGESNPQTASIVVCTSKPLNIWGGMFLKAVKK